jgi:hypothetical protein
MGAEGVCTTTVEALQDSHDITLFALFPFDRHELNRYFRGDSVDGHDALIDDAARALERGDQPPSSLERSRWPMTMMERVREAANEVKRQTPDR